MSIGKRNRNKGHNFERLLVKLFNEKLGLNCVTSRSESKRQDDAGNDIVGCPFVVQAKAGYKKGINYRKLLKEIKQDDKPTIVVHQFDVGKGHKRTDEDTIVVLSLTDFIKLINYENSI